MEKGREGRGGKEGGEREGGRYFNNIPNASLSASTTLYSSTSFSSPPPTTYSMTSLSILKTTTRPS